MKKHKDMINNYLELGRYFINNFNYDLAINTLTEAISKEPDNAKLYDLRGIAYGSTRQYDESIADFNMAIEIDDQVAGTYNNRSLSYWALDMIEEAFSDINKALELEPNIAFFTNRGLIQHARGNFQEAIKDYSVAILMDFNWADAFNGRGEAFAELGENEKALADFKQALAINPKDVVAFANCALVSSLLEERNIDIIDDLGDVS